MTEPLHARIGRRTAATHGRPRFDPPPGAACDARVVAALGPLFGTLVPLAPPPDDGEPSPLATRLRRAPAAAVLAVRRAGCRLRASVHALPSRLRRALPPLLLLLLALWPHGAWVARRLTDGSDEPWGVLALATVIALVLRDRRQLVTPSPRALLAAALLALGAAFALRWMPPLPAAAIAALALAAFLAGALPRRPAAPLVTLLLLALPVIASLQFYLGFPLRVATAQAAAPLLALFGIDAQPAAAALLFRGQTVLIDAPCAGIGMLWVGSYCAALLSYLNGASAGRTLANGLAAAAIVFAANVLRNVALFFPEAGLVAAPARMHDAVGLAAFAVAIVPIFRVAQWRAAAPGAPARAVRARPRSFDDARRPLWPRRAVVRLYVGACLAAAAVPVFARVIPPPGHATSPAPATRSPVSAIDWPTRFRGQPLTQLPLTPLEARFADRFPGAIARFAAGGERLVLRHVTQPTRQLHPAADCFRAAGFGVAPPRVEVDGDGLRWSCFVATRDGARLRVCERIAGADGAAWTDVSAWFWSAQFTSRRGGAGPWWATTVITAQP